MIEIALAVAIMLRTIAIVLAAALLWMGLSVGYKGAKGEMTARLFVAVLEGATKGFVAAAFFWRISDAMFTYITALPR